MTSPQTYTCPMVMLSINIMFVCLCLFMFTHIWWCARKEFKMLEHLYYIWNQKLKRVCVVSISNKTNKPYYQCMYRSTTQIKLKAIKILVRWVEIYGNESTQLKHLKKTPWTLSRGMSKISYYLVSYPFHVYILKTTTKYHIYCIKVLWYIGMNV